MKKKNTTLGKIPKSNIEMVGIKSIQFSYLSPLEQ